MHLKIGNPRPSHRSQRRQQRRVVLLVGMKKDEYTAGCPREPGRHLCRNRYTGKSCVAGSNPAPPASWLIEIRILTSSRGGKHRQRPLHLRAWGLARGTHFLQMDIKPQGELWAWAHCWCSSSGASQRRLPHEDQL